MTFAKRRIFSLTRSVLCLLHRSYAWFLRRAGGADLLASCGRTAECLRQGVLSKDDIIVVFADKQLIFT